MAGTRRIGARGTAARAVIGGALVVFAVAWQSLRWWDVLAALTVLPAIAVGAAAVLNARVARSAARRARSPWSAAQMLAALAVIAAVVLVGTGLSFVSPMNGGAIWLFFGVSMVLAAVRGYEGCEVLAWSNLLFGRRDAIWCPLYALVDAAERAETNLDGGHRT